eukprot:5578405-Pyramimonas_sp.AAC.1
MLALSANTKVPTHSLSVATWPNTFLRLCNHSSPVPFQMPPSAMEAEATAPPPSWFKGPPASSTAQPVTEQNKAKQAKKEKGAGKGKAGGTKMWNPL